MLTRGQPGRKAWHCQHARFPSGDTTLILTAEHCPRRDGCSVRPLRPRRLCLGMRECDLCHELAVKPFASVILSSVGVSLHLFQAQLLPTDRVLCDIAGAAVYPSPRCGVPPAVYLCGLVQCVCCALHRAAEQSWSVPLMSRVVIRFLPRRNMQVAWVEEDAAARFPVRALVVLGPR